MRISSCIIFTLFISTRYSLLSNYHNSSYPISRTFIFRWIHGYIGEREREKKVGKSWELNFLYSNLLEFPNGEFPRHRHRADKTHYRQTFPPPDHDARGKNPSLKVSQCRTRSPRFRRSLTFRKCSKRERERERRRDVNVFRDEDVPWPRAAPSNKALKRVATTTTSTRLDQISEGKERNSWRILRDYPRETLQPFIPRKIPRDSSKRSHALSLNLREIFAQFLKACNFYRGAVQN